MVESKTARTKRVAKKVGRGVKWAFTKPVIRIFFVTKLDKEETDFVEHANKFLESGAIKPEFREKH